MLDAKRDMESWAREVPEGPARELLEGVIADPYPAARALLLIATFMGANSEWSGADYLEWIADEVCWGGRLIHPGNDTNTPTYRQLADAAGMEHDGDEEED